MIIFVRNVFPRHSDQWLTSITKPKELNSPPYCWYAQFPVYGKHALNRIVRCWCIGKYGNTFGYLSCCNILNTSKILDMLHKHNLWVVYGYGLSSLFAPRLTSLQIAGQQITGLMRHIGPDTDITRCHHDDRLVTTQAPVPTITPGVSSPHSAPTLSLSQSPASLLSLHNELKFNSGAAKFTTHWDHPG